MRNADDFLRLRAELSNDGLLLDALLEKNRRAIERTVGLGADEFAWAAVGYTIHNIYCLFENYFLRVSKFFENGLDPAAWHAQLVERMTLEIPGLRPSLFDRAFAARIDELRRFRRAFRNLYLSELDPDRARKLNDALPEIISDFSVFHERFVAALDILAQALREGETEEP
ncbi:MAG: hypothetical protein ABSF43_15085 [Rectinemataceae bacterium]|jgi:hypothetical protein